jgi:hypothetical protein
MSSRRDEGVDMGAFELFLVVAAVILIAAAIGFVVWYIRN